MCSYKVSTNPHGDIAIIVSSFAIYTLFKMSNGQKFVVVQLVAMIIGELKMIAEKSSRPYAVNQIVLNTPVFYGERERSSLVMACRIAGIEHIRLVDDLMAGLELSRVLRNTHFILQAAGHALKSFRTERRLPFRPSSGLSKADLIKCKAINKEIEAHAQHTGEVWSRLNQLKGEILQANSTIASWSEFAYLKDIYNAAKDDSDSMDAWLEQNKSSRQIEEFDTRIAEFSEKVQNHKQKKCEAEKVWSSGVESLEKKIGSARTLIQSWSQPAYLQMVYSEASVYVQAVSEWLEKNKAQLSVEDLHNQLTRLCSKTEFFKQRQNEEEQKERSRLLNRLNEKLNFIRSQLENWRSSPYLMDSIADADTFMASVQMRRPQFAAASLSNLTSENLKLDDWWNGFENTAENRKNSKVKLPAGVTDLFKKFKSKSALHLAEEVINPPTSDPPPSEFNRPSRSGHSQPTNPITVTVERSQEIRPSYDELYTSYMGASPTYPNAVRIQGNGDGYPSKSRVTTVTPRNWPGGAKRTDKYPHK
ncbi:hypothetical protein T265_00641 [Opisthorchis viverrini]|uniref:Uncharacterized protein n=1 Tax=Opisthorchis viverrini TaxID=6198 RepID=A0A075ACB8_OPIVI|nr:hypothetical protein T265_00641 [Opisthorchis viverrini]KER33530.1 hypothetical protein T265_00641 [Opisthorchis viverrini]